MRLRPARLHLVAAVVVAQTACLRLSPRHVSLPRAAEQTQDAEERSRADSAQWFKRHHPDGGLRQRALAAKRQSLARAQTTAGTWNPIGPEPIQVYNGSYSGRIWGIVVDPRNASTIYTGTDGGGVWKTADGGTTWAPLTDAQPNLNIRDLAISPSTPDTLYAATAGGGILKTTDGGANWTTILPGTYLNSISVHPTNGSILLAVDYQLKRSADGGTTWTTTLTSTGSSTTRVIQAVFDPANGNIAYAATGSGLNRSIDSGVTWTPVGGAGLPNATYSYATVAIAPSSTNVLYLALKGPTGHLLGFYKSTDAGATWTQTAAPPNDDVTYWGWSLRVHPANPNILYAGSLRLSTSADGGATWTNNDTAVHVDHHIQTFSPDGATLYVGNDGGIWKTTNATATNISWSSLNANLNTVMFYPGISISPSGTNTAFGGTQDNGILAYTGSLAWKQVYCGDGGFTAIDFVNPLNVYVACQNIQIGASSDGGQTFHSAQAGISLTDPSEFIPPLVMDPSNASRLYFGTNRVYQTVNGAGSWSPISPDLTNNLGGGIAAIGVAPSDPNTIYTGAVNGAVYVSRNALSGGSATWTARNLPSTVSYGTLNQITVDPQNPLAVWAATTIPEYPVFHTIDGGVTWTSLRNGLPPVPVNDLLLDPDIPNTVYAATDVGVYRSADEGQSWLPLGSGAPDVIVHSLRLDRPSRTLRAATYGRGMWDLSVPVSGQVVVTIGSSTPGAYFSLEDGSTHQAPVSFYWYTGAVHTVTWLAMPSSFAGTRTVFSSWTDGVTSNPRSITVASTASTYTANVTVQFQLIVTPVPAIGGAVSLSPASTDGYYNAGTSVQIDDTPTTGYGFWYLSGDLNGNLPQSIAMNAPHMVNVNFYCLNGLDYFPYQLGSQATTGFLEVATGPGCQWSLTSSAAWFALTSASSGTGPATVGYSVVANTGGNRTGSVAVAGKIGSYQETMTQDAGATGRPSIGPVTPDSGTGTAQVFSYQFIDPNGYTNFGSVEMGFETKPYANPGCKVLLSFYSSGQYFYLLSDDGMSWIGPAQLPASPVLQNSQCSLDAGNSSSSGVGNLLNVTIALTFKPSLSGTVSMIASAYDAADSIGSNYQMVGTWIVPGAFTPALTASMTHSGTVWQSETGAAYSVVAGNSGSAPTSGTVTATGSLGADLHASAIFGVGWTCTLGTLTCSRSDALAPGASYPAIAITVNVDATPPAPQTNFVVVSGGGSTPGYGTDITNIQAPTCSFSLGSYGAMLSQAGTASSGGVRPELPVAVNVVPTAGAVCPGNFTGASSASWLSAVGGASGFTFTALSNAHPSPRSGSISIANAAGGGATFTVSEVGDPEPSPYRQVRALYESVLGRDPDGSGFAFWTGAGSVGLGQMLDLFLTSPEAFNSDFAVMAAYQAATGSPPSYTQFISGVAGIRAGGSVDTLFNSLVSSGYTAQNLYHNLLNRAPSGAEINSANAAGLAAWFRALIGYPSNTTPVSPPNSEFMSTGTFHSSQDHTNGLYIAMLYYVILGRDLDASGYNFWLSIANSGGPGVLFEGGAGQSVRLQIVGLGTPNEGFAGSPEFQGLYQ